MVSKQPIFWGLSLEYKPLREIVDNRGQKFHWPVVELLDSDSLNLAISFLIIFFIILTDVNLLYLPKVCVRGYAFMCFLCVGCRYIAQ